jgi:hypothetical protein
MVEKENSLIRRGFRLMISGLILIAISSCHKNVINLDPIKSAHMTEQKWNELSTKRVFFGHQSVGFNIVGGIERNLQQDSMLSYKIIQSKNQADFTVPAFYHAPIGKNVDPKSKIDEFVQLMDGGLGDKVDIAGFKFCYADIRVETNIKELFEYYTGKMDYLIHKYPKVTFMHYTIPITVKPRGLKGIIKILAYDHNLNREKFNQLLISHYPEKSVFDLAKYESSWPDGKINTYSNNRMALIDDYSDDGEHLNAKASDTIAEQLLVFLSDLHAN